MRKIKLSDLKSGAILYNRNGEKTVKILTVVGNKVKYFYFQWNPPAPRDNKP